MIDGKDILESLTKVAAENARNFFHYRIMQAYGETKKAESPIEGVMLWALVLVVQGEFESEFKTIWRHDKFKMGDAPKTADEVHIFKQAQLGKYRADFLISWRIGDKTGYIAIECDGHDFHDKTKEQASRDRERDRYFQAEGVVIYRFTGRDIWTNPYKCGMEVASYLSGRKKAKT